MDDKIYDNYKRAGRIAAEARDFGKTLIKPGVKYLEVAETIESKILGEGAELAFPVNISVNEIAAHYSPKNDDKLTFKRGDIVKLDIGAHVDGYIADTALTVEIETDNYKDMIKASADALDSAIEIIKAGIDLVKIGSIIQKTIKSYGFNPVSNLTGHSLGRYVIHSGMSVPNVPEAMNKGRPKVGDAVAIEPFATNGAGHVISGQGSNIYLCKGSFNPRLIRDRGSKLIFSRVKSKFKTLPFAQRWFEKNFPNSNTNLRKLTFLGLLKHYPQLVEAKKGIVTQKEHTVIIKKDGCEVIT